LRLGDKAPLACNKYRGLKEVWRRRKFYYRLQAVRAEDITILELNTLRLDRDQARNELANKLRERATTENELRRLLGLEREGAVVAAGDVLEISRSQRGTVPDRQKVQACSQANRADLKAAKLAVEVREAELRLAQARRIPNISLGPRYKRDVNQNIVGGEIPIPAVFQSQQEVTIAVNQNISKTELEGRTLSESNNRSLKLHLQGKLTP
jgi:outer membrane protein TolC